MPIISGLKRLRQKGLEFGQAWVSEEFRGILSYMVRFCIKGVRFCIKGGWWYNP